MHLADVGMVQLSQFEIDDDQASQSSMEKKKVHPKPAVSCAQPSLSTDEREIATQLEQKILEPVNEGVFEIAFGILVLQVKELQDIRILDRFLGR